VTSPRDEKRSDRDIKSTAGGSKGILRIINSGGCVIKVEIMESYRRKRKKSRREETAVGSGGAREGAGLIKKRKEGGSRGGGNDMDQGQS